MLNRRRVLGASLIVIALSAVPGTGGHRHRVALAQVEGAAVRAVWSTVGSTGTPDERSRPKLRFDGAVAGVKAKGTVVLRYNVVPTGAALDATGLTMAVRYRDNGAKARVVVALKELDIVSGETTGVVRFDSDQTGASAHSRLREIDLCDFQFDLLDNVYYLEARLEHRNANGRAELHAVQLLPLDCGP